jgi:hypothetical protein
MQEHPLQAEGTQMLVEVLVAVALVPGHGMPGVRGVDPNLMSPTRIDRHLEQRRRLGEPIKEPERAARLLA